MNFFSKDSARSSTSGNTNTIRYKVRKIIRKYKKREFEMSYDQNCFTNDKPLIRAFEKFRLT